MEQNQEYETDLLNQTTLREDQNDNIPAELLRPERTDNPDQATLFDLPPDWQEHWFGMPDFSMRDVRPEYRININFLTADAVKRFADLTGIKVTTSSDSGWFPDQKRLTAHRFHYGGPKTDSKYPVCIPSKGRALHQTTGKVLDEMGVTYKFFVEETEYDEYCQVLGESRVIKLPFHDLGKGSIPARNFIWDWAVENNHARHWIIDDNILHFSRTHNNRRLHVKGGGYFRAIEDFTDRYENIALAGPHGKGFVPDRDPSLPPFRFNRRVYSCTLIDTALSHRWRGRYNEDTDLCLRLMKDGFCTVLFNALTMQKAVTSDAKGAAMPGGNTDNVYNTDDYRRSFAQSLKDQHPDLVEIVWKFNRWHHHVDYSPFKNNKPILKAGVVKHNRVNNYGITLMENAIDTSQDSPQISRFVVDDFLSLAAKYKNSDPVLYRYCVALSEGFYETNNSNFSL